MKTQYHAGISLVIAGALFAAFRSVSLSVSVVLAGIFIDLDHVFDYLREYGFRPDIKFFFHSFYAILYKRISVVFHGWEWVGLFAALTWFTRFDPILTGIFIGMTCHLICDQSCNGLSRWGYFFFFRLKNGFATSCIFPGHKRV
jgi:hypothetical protein